MKKLTLAILGCAILWLDPTAAMAQPTWTVQSLNSIGCASSATTFTTLLQGVEFPTTLRFRTLVDAAGDRYMDEDAGVPASGNGNYIWALYSSNSGGPTTAVFPLPEDTPITVTFRLIDGVAGPTVTEQVIVLTRCNGGTIVGEGSLLEIPTLDRWGLVALAVTLALGGAVLLRRRRAALPH